MNREDRLPGWASSPTKTWGFTLMEMMITLAIVGILLTVGVPSFIEFIQNSRRDAQLSDLTLAVQYAKSEAIKRNLRVSVCAVPGATTACNGGATAWTDGWQVFVDANDNCVVDGGDILLRAWPALDGGNTLCFTGGDRVRVQNTGMSPGSNGTFRVCDPRGTSQARGLVISNQGRTRSATVATCP